MTPDNEPVTQPQVSKLKIAAGVEPVPGYRLVEPLGKGGFGEVWRALGPGDVPVALKLVSLDEGGKVEQRAMEVIKAIRHPHLLPVFGIWRKDNWLIVAMELADRTLLDRYKEAVGQGFQGIPVPEIHQHFADAARGLDYLNEPRHSAGADAGPMAVQHRDIKPQNILLVGGCSKVADFGLARVIEGSTSGHSGGMTPTYAAPEFFAGKTSSQSDQYSLAVTYCHMRGGRPPFTGTIQEVMMAHVSHPPDLSMLPENERPAVARALAKNPKDRWPNCRAFVESLKPDTVSVPPTIPLASPFQWTRRKILAISLSVMLLIIGTTAIARFWPHAAADPVTKEEESFKTEEDFQGASKTSEEETDLRNPLSGTWALEFDGDGDFVRTEYNYAGEYPVTFEAVIIPQQPVRGAIVGAIALGEDPSFGRGVGLAIGPRGHLHMLMINEERATRASDSEPVEPGRRIHVAGRLDPSRPGRLDLFVDGVLQAGTGLANKYEPLPLPIKIGDNYSRSSAPRRSFTGQIEWVRISRILRPFHGQPVSMEPPEPDDDTVLLVDFTKGETQKPVVTPKAGQVVINGPKWVQR